MEQIILSHRVYGVYRNRLLTTFKHVLSAQTSELAVELSNFYIDERGRIIIEIDGEDAPVVKNLLSKDYGLALNIQDLHVNREYEGHLVDVGRVGYGLYVDIGVAHPCSIDVLIPLYSLRAATGLQGHSVNSIRRLLCLVDNLPVKVVLRQVNVKKQELTGEFCKSVIERINQWAQDDHERLLVFGITRQMINKALATSGHSSDIIQIDELGPYEFAIVCKRSTRAAGIVTAIGPFLKGVPIHLFVPGEIAVVKNNDAS